MPVEAPLGTAALKRPWRHTGRFATVIYYHAMSSPTRQQRTDCSLINVEILPYEPLLWQSKCLTLNYVVFTQHRIYMHNHVWQGPTGGLLGIQGATAMYIVVLSRERNKASVEEAELAAEGCDVTGEDSLTPNWACAVHLCKDAKPHPHIRGWPFWIHPSDEKLGMSRKSIQCAQWTSRDGASERI